MSIDTRTEGRDLTTQEYLATLPARARLAPHLRVKFDREVIAYLAIAPHLRECERATRSTRERARIWLGGQLAPFVLAIYRAMHIPDPSEWALCDHCRGTGVLEDDAGTGVLGDEGSPCPCFMCDASGYRIGSECF